MKVMYSNCLGSYVIGKEREDSIKFEKEEIVEKSFKLENEELLEEEKQLLKKHPEALFINKKSDRSIKQLDDVKKINEILKKFSEKSKEYFESEILIAKAKVKQSVKFDNLLVNSIGLIEELTKTINLFSRRLNEWYSLYNPEYSKISMDNVKFAKKIIEKSRKELLKEISIEEKNSMGSDLREKDVNQVLTLASKIVELDNLKNENEKYIEELMKENCPNIHKIAGTLIGAKLISLAGSLERMAELPASTIQLLGAEKAFFRHIKTGSRIPKHGVVLQHQLVQQAKNRGKASRILADKISIAAKIDFFKGEFRGDELLEEVKKKLQNQGG